MGNNIDIKQLVHQYDDEFERGEKLNLHINMMYLEMQDIKKAIFIFKTVQKEWNRRYEDGEKIGYSAIRTVLYESLAYRIILGWSKIMSRKTRKTEHSLLKVINIVSNIEEYKNDNDVMVVVEKVRDYVKTNEMLRVIEVYRNKLFAHLDKECVLSDCRIDLELVMDRITENEIDQGIMMISELYEVCFGDKLTHSEDSLSEQDIIQTFFWM